MGFRLEMGRIKLRKWSVWALSMSVACLAHLRLIIGSDSASFIETIIAPNLSFQMFIYNISSFKMCYSKYIIQILYS